MKTRDERLAELKTAMDGFNSAYWRLLNAAEDCRGSIGGAADIVKAVRDSRHGLQTIHTVVARVAEMVNEARAFGEWARRRYMRRHDGARPVADDPETAARFARDFAFLSREIGESPEAAPIGRIQEIYKAWLSGYVYAIEHEGTDIYGRMVQVVRDGAGVLRVTSESGEWVERPAGTPHWRGWTDSGLRLQLAYRNIPDAIADEFVKQAFGR